MCNEIRHPFIIQPERCEYTAAHRHGHHTHTLIRVPRAPMKEGRHSKMSTSREGTNRGKLLNKVPRLAFYRASHSLFTAGLLLLSFRHLLLVDSATCCVNSTSGLAFDSLPCVCLVDNAQVTGQNLTRGESALYHWVLESSSAELITLVPRGNLTFRVSCRYRYHTCTLLLQ